MKQFLLVGLFFLAISCQAQKTEDEVVFDEFLNYADTEKIAEKEAGERLAAIGLFFMDTPYQVGTLEADGPERLQVNLRGLDCTTLVENALALSLMLQTPYPDFETFKSKLTLIRYRDGILDAYPSRLHYTSDWIGNNQAKGLMKTVCMGDSAEPFSPNVHFMTTHPGYYPALKTTPEFVTIMAMHEARINQSSNLMCLPKEYIQQAIDSIHTGDIIAITTNIPGLDYSHLGLAVKDRNGQVYLLHASSTGKKVLISEQPLYDYLMSVRKHIGITLVRPQ
jgi:hypothetical protein